MDYNDIFKLIAGDLKEVENVIEENIQSEVPLVYEISKYLLGSGGKRLRPSVLLLASGSCGLLKGKERIKAAAALELIHTATLLHDDVVDDAEVRRGKTSSNLEFGNKPTVLVGDFMLAKALGLMQECGNLELIKAVTDASAKLAEGQVLEVMSGKNMVEITEEICFAIMEFKTASLIESCGKIGGILAGSENGNVKALSDYGLHIGLAFQLIDDALDYSSTEEVFGKQVGQDILEGKMTLPLFYSIEKASDNEKEEIKIILDKEELKETEVDHLRGIVKKYNGVETTKDVARKYISSAKNSINKIPSNQYKDSLSSLADFVVDRIN